MHHDDPLTLFPGLYSNSMRYPFTELVLCNAVFVVTHIIVYVTQPLILLRCHTEKINSSKRNVINFFIILTFYNINLVYVVVVIPTKFLLFFTGYGERFVICNLYDMYQYNIKIFQNMF